jgi:hypothetical protein
MSLSAITGVNSTLDASGVDVLYYLKVSSLLAHYFLFIIAVYFADGASEC